MHICNTQTLHIVIRTENNPNTPNGVIVVLVTQRIKQKQPRRRREKNQRS